MHFLLRKPILRGYVSFREGNLVCLSNFHVKSHAKISSSPLLSFINGFRKQMSSTDPVWTTCLVFVGNPPPVFARNSKQPILNGCFSGMTPNHYVKNSCFTISIHSKLVVYLDCLKDDLFTSYHSKSPWKNHNLGKYVSFFPTIFSQLMVTWWFGLVVWIPKGSPDERDYYLKVPHRIPNHPAPNQQLTLS